jgi:type IV secretion system protein VirB10
MSDSTHAGEARPKEDPEALVLRGRPRPVVRFRRGVIVGITGAVAATLATLSWLALEPPSMRKLASPIESDEPSGKAAPDALSKLPGSYGDVPRLGPPLPGDLGRPILQQQRELADASAPAPFGDAAEHDEIAQAELAARERLAAAGRAARSSPVLVELGAAAANAPPTGPQPVDPGSAAVAGEEQAADGASTAQQRKTGFAGGPTGDFDPHRLNQAASPLTLSAGTVIPASLITGLDSDLPGTVLAQVTHDVSDSATGRTVLVPQGARLLGSYDSAISYGQRRALVVWTRILFPDGSSIALDKVPASDASGFVGIEDKVDSHGWQLLKGAVLSTLLGIGTQLAIGGSGNGLVRAIREAGQQNGASIGEQITARNLDVKPTIRVRPGWPVRAIVTKDLVIQPWRG